MESLNKVFAVIGLLEKRKELRLQEIADALHLYKSTAYRIVSALCVKNYLERNDESKKYRLGLKFIDISRHVIENLDIREAARKGIEELNRITVKKLSLRSVLLPFCPG